MTWGSNATGERYTCRFCGGDAYDDRDEGPSSHELACPEAGIIRRLVKFFGFYEPMPVAKVVKRDK